MPNSESKKKRLAKIHNLLINIVFPCFKIAEDFFQPISSFQRAFVKAVDVHNHNRTKSFGYFVTNGLITATPSATFENILKTFQFTADNETLNWHSLIFLLADSAFLKLIKGDNDTQLAIDYLSFILSNDNCIKIIDKKQHEFYKKRQFDDTNFFFFPYLQESNEKLLPPAPFPSPASSRTPTPTSSRTPTPTTRNVLAEFI